jgi:hypothetical protein
MAVKSLIETVTVGAGGAASIEFTGIPQDGSDLVLKMSVRSDGTNTLALVNLNGDSGSNYSYVDLWGSGDSDSSGSGTLTAARVNGQPSSSTADTFGNSELYISNFTSLIDKSISFDGVNENNATEAYQRLYAYSYSTTSGITSISIAPNGVGDWVEYSTASLYKIKYD